VDVHINPTICFDGTLLNEAQRYYGLHVFEIVILEDCPPVTNIIQIYINTWLVFTTEIARLSSGKSESAYKVLPWLRGLVFDV
jgi:hypothetical protein